MSQDNQNLNKSNDDVDVIRLLNYFKNGIKSIFRGIGKIFQILFFFLYLLRKNWMISAGLVTLGALFGGFIKPMIDNPNVKTYEMVVRTNPISNIELYAFGSEVNNQESTHANLDEEGMKLAKKLGIIKMKVEPIEKGEDVVNNYFEQIENNTVRGMDTDTLFFLDFQLKDHKVKMDDLDYSLQKIQLKVNTGQQKAKDIQDNLIEYLDNLPGVKNYQQARLAELKNYEEVLKTGIANMDSLLIARANAYNNSNSFGTEPSIVSGTTKNNIEADILGNMTAFGKRLYGTQKLISHYQNGVSIVSNLRSVKEKKLIDNAILRYAVFGFILASLIILGLRFNKYLNKFEKE